MTRKILMIGFLMLLTTTSFASGRGDLYKVIGTLEGKLYVQCALSAAGEEIVKEKSWKRIPRRGTFILANGNETIEKVVLVDERPGFFKGKWSQLGAGHHKIGFVDDRGDVFSIYLVSSESQASPSLCVLDVEELKEISTYEFGL